MNKDLIGTTNHSPIIETMISQIPATLLGALSVHLQSAKSVFCNNISLFDCERCLFLRHSRTSFVVSGHGVSANKSHLSLFPSAPLGKLGLLISSLSTHASITGVVENSVSSANVVDVVGHRREESSDLRRRAAGNPVRETFCTFKDAGPMDF